MIGCRCRAWELKRWAGSPKSYTQDIFPIMFVVPYRAHPDTIHRPH